MSAPKKYDQEFRDRAVRMYRDRLEQGGTSLLGARRQVGALLDLKPATLRNWVEEGERAEGTRPAATASRPSDSEEVRGLKRRVAELERANDILKTSAAFFAQAELDRRFKRSSTTSTIAALFMASSRSARSWPWPGWRSRPLPTTPQAGSDEPSGADRGRTWSTPWSPCGRRTGASTGSVSSGPPPAAPACRSAGTRSDG
ncbi:MAG: transposase [Actinomycetota bacterium]